MSKIFYALFFSLFVSAATDAQTRQPLVDIPPFRMLQTKGTMYSATDLKENRPVAIIYFSPDCEHCMALMKDFFKNISQFKNTEIVLITFRRIEDLKPFELQFKIASYPNIKVGTEGNTFYLRNFYHIENTPFTAIFTKQRRLVSFYKYLTPPQTIIDQLRLSDKAL